jgi:tetratricopeptide (TPR) repeat protein
MAIEYPRAARPVEEELRCPTCGARQGWVNTCRRCKSDLRLLRSALRVYEVHRRRGLQALDAGRLEEALQHARRCHELRPDRDSHRLLAVCHLLRGEWAEALELASAANRSES